MAYFKKTIGLALVLLLSATVHAADNTDVQRRIDALDEQVRALRQELTTANENAAKAKSSGATLVAGDKGFGLKSADGQFELKLRGLLQFDVRDFDEGIKGQPTGNIPNLTTTDAPDNYLARRVRPMIEGTVNEIYGFRITPDYGGSATTLVDAFIEANYAPYAKVRVGKFTPPLGLERLQSAADTKFNESSLVSDFLPSRDVGAQLSGDVWLGVASTVNYAVGIFNGANDGVVSDNSDINSDKELQARIFALPFVNGHRFLQGFGVGIAASSYDARGSTGNTGLSKYKTIGQEDFFGFRSDTVTTASTNPPTTDSVSTVYLDGKRDRLIPQFHYFNGSVALLGEYVEESEDISRYRSTGAPPVANPANRSDELHNRAWHVTAAWTITGEEQSLKGIKPSRNFDSSGDGWGAWELVARTGELTIDKDAFEVNGVLGNINSFAEATKSAQHANNLGLGVNWYPNKAIRIALDYNKTTFKWGGGGLALTPLDRPDEEILIGRVQVAF